MSFCAVKELDAKTRAQEEKIRDLEERLRSVR